MASVVEGKETSHFDLLIEKIDRERKRVQREHRRLEELKRKREMIHKGRKPRIHRSWKKALEPNLTIFPEHLKTFVRKAVEDDPPTAKKVAAVSDALPSVLPKWKPPVGKERRPLIIKVEADVSDALPPILPNWSTPVAKERRPLTIHDHLNLPSAPLAGYNIRLFDSGFGEYDGAFEGGFTDMAEFHQRNKRCFGSSDGRVAEVQEKSLETLEGKIPLEQLKSDKKSAVELETKKQEKVEMKKKEKRKLQKPAKIKKKEPAQPPKPIVDRKKTRNTRTSMAAAANGCIPPQDPVPSMAEDGSEEEEKPVSVDKDIQKVPYTAGKDRTALDGNSNVIAAPLLECVPSAEACESSALDGRAAMALELRQSNCAIILINLEMFHADLLTSLRHLRTIVLQNPDF